jgi:hypothetical protein
VIPATPGQPAGIVAGGNDRTQVFNHAQHIYVARKVGDPIYTGLPSGEATDTSVPKSANGLAAMISDIGFDNIGYFDYRTIVAARAAFRNTIGAQPMDGWKGQPADNETAKGKFLLLGEPGIYENLQFDEHVLNNRTLTKDLVQTDFNGVIAQNILFREECYPHIYAVDVDDGTVSEPDPEIEKLLPSTGYGSDERYETVPNPLYTNGLIGVAYLLGFEPWEDINVGSPPKEFSADMSDADFGKLNWNGETRVIAPTIINYPGNVIASNDYGGWLKIICDCTFGFMPKTPRHILPIVYRRDKYPSLRL